MVIRATTAKLSLGQEHPAAPQPHCSLGNGLGDALTQADPAPSHLGAGMCVCVCVTGQEVRGLSHYSHFACVTAVVQANSTACSLMGFLSSLSAEAVDFDADEAFCF